MIIKYDDNSYFPTTKCTHSYLQEIHFSTRESICIQYSPIYRHRWGCLHEERQNLPIFKFAVLFWNSSENLNFPGYLLSVSHDKLEEGELLEKKVGSQTNTIKRIWKKRKHASYKEQRSSEERKHHIVRILLFHSSFHTLTLFPFRKPNFPQAVSWLTFMW